MSFQWYFEERISSRHPWVLWKVSQGAAARRLGTTELESRPASTKLRAASSPMEGFVRPSLGFRCRIIRLHTDNYWQPAFILITLHLTFLRQAVFSTTSSRLCRIIFICPLIFWFPPLLYWN